MKSRLALIERTLRRGFRPGGGRFHSIGLGGALVILMVAALPDSAVAQSVVWQVSKDGGLSDPGAAGYLSAIDAAGNVYAAGWMRNGIDADFLLVAWDSSGALRWTRTHDGKDRSTDRPAAMALDGAGNIVISGTATRSGVDSFLTVSFDPAGELRWSRLWNHPKLSDAAARSLAVAPDGRVVVAGRVTNGSQSSGQIVGYDEDGTELWSVVRDFIPNWRAAAASIGGDFFVTGGPSSNVFADFVTVAFNSSGIELWTSVKDAGTTDFATALAVAADGRVLVTGMHSDGPDSGILTVAYDGGGSELWSTVTDAAGSYFDRPTGITLDAAGAAYVVGHVGFEVGEAVVVFSLDTAGAERWLSLRESTGSGSEEANGIAVDDFGRLAIAGYTWDGVSSLRGVVAGYEGSSGLPLWVKEIAPISEPSSQLYAVRAGPAGNFVAVGWTGFGEDLSGDLVVVSQEGTGSDLWTRREPLMGSADVPGSNPGWVGRGALAVGADERIFVTGRSSQAEVHDALTVAYDLAGNELWSVRRPSLSPFAAGGMAIAADRLTGNVYVMGQAFGANDADYLVDSYDVNGFARWSRTKSGESGRGDHPCCLELGDGGEIYVSGYAEKGADQGLPDVLTVAYEDGGNELWSHEFDSGPGRADSARATAIGSTGMLFLAGDSVSSEGVAEALVLAYDPDGTLMWARSRPGSNGEHAQFFELAALPNGGVVATGRTGTGEAFDVLTVAYDDGGSEQWSVISAGLRGGSDGGLSVAVAPSGAVYVAASSYAPGWADQRFMTIALSAAGQERWVRERVGVAGKGDSPAAIMVDGFGNVVVTGESDNGIDGDFLTIAYSPGGIELFEYRFDSGGRDNAYLMQAIEFTGILIGGVSQGLERDFLLYRLQYPGHVFSDVSRFPWKLAEWRNAPADRLMMLLPHAA